MKVVFRVDSSLDIGFGHVMRCLTLADELTKSGEQCCFISRQQPGTLIALIKQRGFRVYELPECDHPSDSDLAHSQWLKCGQERDVSESKNILEELATDWLIIDHYGIDKTWEQKARAHVKNILVIDDLADRSHDCDVLVDQNLGQTQEMYSDLVPPTSRILTGCNYALLRPEFAAYRGKSLEYRLKAKEVEKLLISMGGADKDNYTERALEALEASGLKDLTQVVVVMGEGSPWFQRIKIFGESSRFNIKIVTNVSNMAELMTSADLAIGAAGTTSWERCCLGLPTVMCVIADNQRVVADSLTSEDAAMLADGGSITQSIRQLVDHVLKNKVRLAELSRKAARLVDGQGAERVVQAMRQVF